MRRMSTRTSGRRGAWRVSRLFSPPTAAGRLTRLESAGCDHGKSGLPSQRCKHTSGGRFRPVFGQEPRPNPGQAIAACIVSSPQLFVHRPVHRIACADSDAAVPILTLKCCRQLAGHQRNRRHRATYPGPPGLARSAMPAGGACSMGCAMQSPWTRRTRRRSSRRPPCRGACCGGRWWPRPWLPPPAHT
jgi:hypothetical protein